MDRKRKIALLKAIEAGKTTVSKAFMPPLATWYEKDGLYSNGEVSGLTEAQREGYMQEHPAKCCIVYRHQSGNEPLNEKD